MEHHHKDPSKNSVTKPNCTHIRIRDNNDYNIDVDNFIKSIESQFQIDIKSLPQWKEIIKRLHVAQTDYNQKIQDVNLRKAMIIDKLYMQWTRPSPFELSANFARTAGKWELNKRERKKCKIVLVPEIENIHVSVEEQSVASESSAGHPNTEIVSLNAGNSNRGVTPEPSYIQRRDQMTDAVSDTLPYLPTLICTNQHRLVSPLDSKLSGLSYKCDLDNISLSTGSKENEWLVLNSSTSVFCTPRNIYLYNNDVLKKQFVQFSVTNCSTKYVHVRFICVTDDSPFKEIKILPVIPLRIYPGITFSFRFVFRLRKQEEFRSALYFKVGYNIYDKIPSEAFCIPIISSFNEARSITVSDTVSMSPVYLWHLKNKHGYQSGNINVCVNDSYTYHLHIYKREVDFLKGSKESLPVDVSLETRSPTEVIEVSQLKKSSGKMNTIEPKPEQQALEKLKILEAITSIVNDIVQLALESFVLKHTYLYLEPHSKQKIPVYFTKAEYIGKHQCYYDLEFRDVETDEVVMMKTVKVFAEILPHPIQIHPEILDMSQSYVRQGFCESYFVVVNNHKLYPVTVKIKLTTKMRKLFYVIPMETVIPTTSSVNFEVKLCSKDFLLPRKPEEFVIFTFKVIVIGYKAVYENVPPFFYEVIAPAAREFKELYGPKFFKDGPDCEFC